MKEIIDLIKKLESLISEREEELQVNKHQEEILDHEYQMLKTEKSVIDVDISSTLLKKEKVERITKKMKQQLVGANILSTLSISLIALLGIMAFEVITKFSIFKSVFFALLFTLGLSPLVIKNEFKEYRQSKKELGTDTLEQVLNDLIEKNKELTLNLDKQSLNRTKRECLKEKNIELKNEIKKFEEYLGLLKDIKNVTIEQSLKSNKILDLVLNEIYKENNDFEVDKGFQKIKK